MDERTRSERGPVGFAVLALLNFLMLLLVNLHAVWRPWLGGVVTERFSEVLWAWNLSFAVQIVGNLILAVANPQPLRRFFELIFAILAFIGGVVFYRVFPLDLSAFGDFAVMLARVVIILSIFGASVAIVANLAKLFFGGGGGTRQTPAHP